MDYQSFVDGKKTCVISPAGYGKTYTIVECLKYTKGKQLILTHTHAGVASIKEKIKKAQISTHSYNIETISSFAQKYVNAFYLGEEKIPDQEEKEYHSFIIDKSEKILKSKLVKQVIKASYCGLFVDEYQDCNKAQHKMITALSEVLPTHILGDPLQGIFDFNGEPINFGMDLSDFEIFPELSVPYRWENNNKNLLGDDLSQIRNLLKNEQSIDLKNFKNIDYFEASAKDRYSPLTEYNKELQKIRNEKSVVLITPITTSINPRITFIQKFPEFSLVEAIDDKDFYKLSKELDNLTRNITEENVRNFSYKIFNKSGLDSWFNKKGFKAKQNDNEKIQIIDIKNLINKTNSTIIMKNILEKIEKLNGIKLYRKELFFYLKKALETAYHQNKTVLKAMKDLRNNVRRCGKKIQGKCIGTTLLTKGLEFDTVVILDAHKFNCPKNLYVALTRCCKKLIIFTENTTLNPYKKT